MNILEFFETPRRDSLTFEHPYIIAEAGVNHEGSLDTAKLLIDQALEGGANAIKFQTYKAESLASVNSPAYWDTTKEKTESQFQLFKKHDKFWKNEFEELKKHCDLAGIEFLSTPFDTKAADFLNDLMPVFKVSSSDITNKPFIKYLCDFNKPIILSTGASDIDEIHEATKWIEEKNVPYSLLHCVLNYPTKDKNANLGMIRGLKREFPNIPIGYSDHTMPKDMRTLEMATLLGACILEKHFTHNKELQGNDHYHAMNIDDLKAFSKNLSTLFELYGTDVVKSLESENKSRLNARRSLVAKRSFAKGDVITKEDITWKRPAHGISPKFIDEVIGKKVLLDIEEDELLKWEKLS